MQTYATYHALTAALCKAALNQTPESMKAEMAKRSDLYVMLLAMRVYNNAKHSERAKAQGLIGVGLITHADNALTRLNRRLNALAAKYEAPNRITLGDWGFGGQTV